ncbi:MAG: coenzyme F420-0:L-glutamate ligase [Promethearchaeota archaeon]
MTLSNQIQIIGLNKIPLIKKGDNIPELIIRALEREKLSLMNNDIVVIAQTIISKSIGKIRNLKEVKPTKKALKLFDIISPKAKEKGISPKSPELIQAIIDESKEILKAEHVLITETKHGFICANAGIDKSNIEGTENVSLLPKDPDSDANYIRTELKKKTNKDIAVIISDSFGRAFRKGAVGVAIGVSGIEAILDKRGSKDLFGYQLQSTIIAQVDSLASAAQLVMGEANEGIPVVIIRGYKFKMCKNASIKAILREKHLDLFQKETHPSLEKILKTRRSYKLDFSNTNIDKKLIEECIDIARWAPSAHNSQFWRYIILEKDSLRKTLVNKMNEKLKIDLKKDGKPEDFINKKIKKTRKQFLEAPFLILLCLDSTDLEKYPNSDRENNEFIMGVQSISCSAIYFLLALHIKHLVACWYCAPLFAKKIIKEVLILPESYVPMAFFTVGYPKTKVKAPNRKELNEIIFKLK